MDVTECVLTSFGVVVMIRLGDGCLDGKVFGSYNFDNTTGTGNGDIIDAHRQTERIGHLTSKSRTLSV